MDGPVSSNLDDSDFVEVDPTGRYGRYNEVLGKGASKTVYKAFDEYQGIEVAWNQVKLYDSLRSPEDLERLCCEIHLLKTLKHDNIMKFYTSWVDVSNRNINFVTEMFTSGTLRQYRLKHRRVNIRAVKHWCRQILKGLLYLHSHNPPVIHRDLKCDNIFVNGNQGEVKIGDLGLAAILRKSHTDHCVGTPEFMAPEVYEEEYNELVDIYSFGMCVLEMVTFEYPYSECTHPAQIYKKVISGKKPDCLYKVQHAEVRNFVEKCLATVSSRLSARELLEDPFLQDDDLGSNFVPMSLKGDPNGHLLRQPHHVINYSESSLLTTDSNKPWHYAENEQEYCQIETEMSEIDLFSCHEEEHLANIVISIRGRRRENDGIFLRLRITDREGCIRNIYFPFDIKTDTALSVVAEMVWELDIADQDVLKIANMIDVEIATLVPDWKIGHGTEEGLQHPEEGFCQNCSSNGNLWDYVSSSSPVGKNLQIHHCSRHYCTAAYGRFEEISYQVEGTEQCGDIDCMEGGSSQFNKMNYTDIWAQRDVLESSSQGTREIHCDDGIGFRQEASFDKEERIINMDSLCTSSARNSISLDPSTNSSPWDNYENEIRQELRWLKAKYQKQLSELRNHHAGVEPNFSIITPNSAVIEELDNGGSLPLNFHKEKRQAAKPLVKSVFPEGHSAHFSVNSKNRCASSDNNVVKNSEATEGACCHELVSTARSFFGRTLVPYSLQRAASLPVEVIDV